MVEKHARTILEAARPLGWVLEPDAKALMKSRGFEIPEFILTSDFESADTFLKAASGPIVAKAVSKKILHKTEHGAVVTGIRSSDHLKAEMERLKKLEGCNAILLEHMVQGIEVMIGGKNDFQFGPVIVLGMGGTFVEIYNDTAVRMAPLKPEDVVSMLESLRGKALLTGYRGSRGVNREQLIQLMVNFSHLMMECETQIESIDLNPVMCTQEACIIADARIILNP